MSKNLVENSRESFGAETAAALTGYFNRLALPVPHEGEFTTTWENGYLVFLNDAACVIRMMPRALVPDADCPVLLKPVGSREAGRLRIDLYPGVACPVTEADATALADFLKKHGYNFWDRKTQNAGYLPSAEDMTRLPVVIDPCAVVRLRGQLSFFEELISLRGRVMDWINPSTRDSPLAAAAGPETVARAQDRLYGPLRALFAAVTDDQESGAAKPDSAAVKLWDACAAMKRAGTLVAGWLDNKRVQAKNYKNARDGSQKYAERIRQESGLFPASSPSL